MAAVHVLERESFRRQTQIEDAYDEFRLELQGKKVSGRTLDAYDYHVKAFLGWLRSHHPEVRRFEHLKTRHLRVYRGEMAERTSCRRRPLTPETLQGSHAHIRAFLRWADREDEDEDVRYEVRPGLLRLPRITVPDKEPTVYHIDQLRRILAECNPDYPVQELIIRMLVGSGVRISELCGLAIQGLDGLPDLLPDTVQRGRSELRVRWDGGAKGQKSRRVPITARLAAAIKRYQGRHRPDVDCAELLVSSHGEAFTKWGIDTMLDRIQRRPGKREGEWLGVGFRVHAHAFRHTFATVACQLDWNFERLRAAMGHTSYDMLQKYVKLAPTRDLGSKKEWAEFVLDPSLLG